MKKELETLYTEYKKALAENKKARKDIKSQIKKLQDQLLNEDDPVIKVSLEVQIEKLQQKPMKNEVKKRKESLVTMEAILEKKIEIVAPILIFLKKMCAEIAAVLKAIEKLKTKWTEEDRWIAQLEVKLESATTEGEKMDIRKQIRYAKNGMDDTKKEFESLIQEYQLSYAKLCKKMEANLAEYDADL